jgi:hypothetical protein
MNFIFNDGGRAAAGYNGSARDCVVRSIAIATGKPYQEVYRDIECFASAERPRGRKRRSSPRLGVQIPTIRRYMKHLGWSWVPTMKIGQGCKVHLADGELTTTGRLVVSVSRHLTAVIDGDIHDTFDPRRGDSWSFEKDTGQELKEGQSRNENGVWTKIGGRCVYGYFVKE